ncbi:regulatory protein, luxR family [Spirosomataceae bacterium TFI 002]|nr:regulatory protein, luxR family [Spirosomataceae bacterium TFI 002]
MVDSKLNNKPKKLKQVQEDLLYLGDMISSEKYIPLNLSTCTNINFRRAIELERFKIEYKDIFSNLSKTEIKVMTLLAEGHKRVEIGEVLFISPNTVRTHRNNIYKKLSISRFADLILFSRAFDLI